MEGTKDFVLVKIKTLVKEKVEDTTLDLQLESLDELKDATDCGEVVAVPQMLTDLTIAGRAQGFPPEAIGQKHLIRMNEITPKVKVGDKIYFNFQVTGYEENTVTQTEDGIICRCRYDKIYCVVRSGKVIPIGSHALVTPIMESENDILHPVPGLPREKWILKKPEPGRVYLTGKIIAVDDAFTSDGDMDLQDGDTVFFRKNADKELFIEGNSVFPIRQKDLIYKITA